MNIVEGLTKAWQSTNNNQKIVMVAAKIVMQTKLSFWSRNFIMFYLFNRTIFYFKDIFIPK